MLPPSLIHSCDSDSTDGIVASSVYNAYCYAGKLHNVPALIHLVLVTSSQSRIAIVCVNCNCNFNF